MRLPLLKYVTLPGSFLLLEASKIAWIGLGNLLLYTSTTKKKEELFTLLHTYLIYSLSSPLSSCYGSGLFGSFADYSHPLWTPDARA